jgi:glyoxylase-like metal-dependent hydrolase (beta-lactamase superfamily II)
MNEGRVRVRTQNEWFEVRHFDHGVVGIGEPGHDENVKSFLVLGDDRALLFDTGMGIGNIKRVVDEITAKPVLVVNSHGHWDHVGDDWRFERIWIHEAEADDLKRGVPNSRTRRFLAPERFTSGVPDWIDIDTFAIPGVPPEHTLSGGERIDLGGREFLVINTPGHSPGGITLVEEKTGVALVGDAVYAGALYAHLDHSDPRVYRQTLKTLADLAPNLSTIYPCHNDYPLPPSFLVDVHEGYESIWNGRAPDGVTDGVERYTFDGYSVLLRETWRG